MLRVVHLDPADLSRSAAEILDAWKSALIVHIRPGESARQPFDVRGVYHALLPQIGTPHFFAENVRVGGRDRDRTGELWTEVRFDPAFPDAYRHSTNAQPLHTDGSYIPLFPNATLMCCVHNAARGGETVFISGDALVSALQIERPDLLEKLKSTEMPHQRSGDRRVCPVLRRVNGSWLLNWNYYCVANDCAPAVRELRESFFGFLRDSERVRRSLIEVKLGPGDAVVWKDERVLHGRHAFEALEISERFLWKASVDVGVFA